MVLAQALVQPARALPAQALAQLALELAQLDPAQAPPWAQVLWVDHAPQALQVQVLARLRAVIQAATNPSPPQANRSPTSRRRPRQRQATRPLTTLATSRRRHLTGLVTGPAQTTKGSYPQKNSRYS